MPACFLHVFSCFLMCILVLSFTHSTPELPNKQNDKTEIIPAPEDDLDLQVQANVGQGLEEEEDR